MNCSGSVSFVNCTLANFKLYSVNKCSGSVIEMYNKNVKPSFELENLNIVKHNCFWHSLAKAVQRISIVSVFKYSFVYIYLLFAVSNRQWIWLRYKTKWKLHCCLMSWHLQNREFIKSKLGRSSNMQSKFGKISTNIKRCGFIDIEEL